MPGLTKYSQAESHTFEGLEHTGALCRSHKDLCIGDKASVRKYVAMLHQEYMLASEAFSLCFTMRNAFVQSTALYRPAFASNLLQPTFCKQPCSGSAVQATTAMCMSFCGA